MAFADEITVAALEADPYPIFARLRREAPVAWVPAANVWFVTRWKDVERVTKNTKLFAAEVATSPVDRTMGTPTILTCDGPAHGELRRGFDAKYKPRAVADTIDDLARPIIAAHLDRIAGKGSAELLSEYFEPASSIAVARSLGFDDVDAETLLRWFHGLAIGAANYENDPKKQAIADRTSAEVDAAILPAIERLERTPDGSAVSHMLHDGMPEGQTRAREFLLPSIKVALLGGMQEPGHGAATVLVGLLTNPEQKRAVLADMDTLLPKASMKGCAGWRRLARRCARQPKTPRSPGLRSPKARRLRRSSPRRTGMRAATRIRMLSTSTAGRAPTPPMASARISAPGAGSPSG